MGQSPTSIAGIHHAPIVIPAKELPLIQLYPIDVIHLFRSDSKGNAIAIPFQIDEKDHFGDYILDQGLRPNKKFTNGIFDFQDELSFMGNDVGEVKVPTKWRNKPPILYEILIHKGSKKGAVYAGIYFKNRPAKNAKQYVVFDRKRNLIKTSKYNYHFNPQNYLVVKGLDIHSKQNKKVQTKSVVQSSSVFLKADLKYFLTFAINHNDFISELEAYKVGPVRTLARLNFKYRILKLNFDLGMFTEVSFFSNALELPAVIENPLDGKKSLNKGSFFYYGFNLNENPKLAKVSSNMEHYKTASFFDFLNKKPKSQTYWIKLTSPSFGVYAEMSPSAKMLRSGNVPMFYRKNQSGHELKKFKSVTQNLSQSPINLAFILNLQNLSAGKHHIKFRLFLENAKHIKNLADYKTLGQWAINTKRLK